MKTIKIGGRNASRACRRFINYPEKRHYPVMNAVIFDMDGVIIDSEPIHIRVESAYFAELGLSISDEEHESFLGTSSHEMFGNLKERYGLRESIDELVEEERRRYLAALGAGEMPVVPGIPELVAALAEGGFALAVASSSPHEQIEAVLDRSGLNRSIRVKVSGDDVPRSKPDPAVFLKAAEILGADPASCWVIEDSSNGIQAGRDAGMRVIAYAAPEAPAQDLSEAHHIVETMEAAGKIIRDKNK